MKVNPRAVGARHYQYFGLLFYISHAVPLLFKHLNPTLNIQSKIQNLKSKILMGGIGVEPILGGLKARCTAAMPTTQVIANCRF